MARRPSLLPVVALAALWLASGACSGDGATGTPDAFPAPADGPPACEVGGDTGGEPFELKIGLTTDTGGFDELLDGEDCPLVIGSQGALMLISQLRAVLADAPGTLCCGMEIAPIGSFAGIDQAGRLGFTPSTDGAADAFSLVILGGREQLEPTLDGADAQVTVSCSDPDHSGRVERTLGFYVPH